MSNEEEKKDTEARSSGLACDYLVIGAGATGMAFVDTFLAHSTNDAAASPSVIMVDTHSAPGGQWNDSYSYVRLHQPSKGYGVETELLEPAPSRSSGEAHRATRTEILHYYDRVRTKLEDKYNFRFLGDTWFDLTQLEKDDSDAAQGEGDTIYQLQRRPSNNGAPDSNDDGQEEQTVSVRVLHKVVDARYLEPDLPIHVAPKFTYNDTAIDCVPVNALALPSSSDNSSSTTAPAAVSVESADAGQQQKKHKAEVQQRHYVVIGGGKTGMDAVTYLQTSLHVDPEDILWIVPNEAWITAREDIGSCMEFLHACVEIAKREAAETANGECSEGKGEMKEGGEADKDHDKETPTLEKLVRSEYFFHEGFLEWERTGKIYRLFQNAQLPTKFKDATLSKDELTLLQKVTKVIRGHGRVQSISDDGTLNFENGASIPLPWNNGKEGGAVVDRTTFVHASAGAFNYSKNTTSPPPVFSDKLITIQDVYGTPGFCFVGSILGKLESLSWGNDGGHTGNKLSDADRNAMCLAHQPDPTQANLPLGPSGGDVGAISKDHGYVQRVCNLQKWLQVPEISKWLVGHRLFNLGHLTGEEMVGMVDEIMDVLVTCGLVSA